MSLLQTVTSALVLLFSRLLLIGSRGSSSIFHKNMGENSLPGITRCMQLTCIFTVTTVTNKNKTLLKAATGNGFRFVTAPSKIPPTVTNCYKLLQTVTCTVTFTVTFMMNWISISYKKCYSRHPKNPYLGISLSQFQNQPILCPKR